MAKGISIGVAADTKEFTQGVKNGIIEPLEGVQDVMKDVEKAGDKATDSLTDGFKDQQQQTKNLKKEYADTSDTIRSESRRTGRSLGDDFSRGTKEAEGGLKDLKSESASTAKETAASFDGSAQSITGAFQEVAANAFIGFGPAGLAAGLAAAAGIGLISTAIESAGVATEETKQKVADLAGEYIDAGGTGVSSLEYLIDKLKEMATETEEGQKSLSEIQKIANDAEADFGKLATRVGLGAKELYNYRDASKETSKQLALEADALDQSTNAGITRYSELQNQITAQDKITALYGESATQARLAAEAEAAYVAAGGPELERKAELIETVNDAYDEAAASASDYIVAESGLFDTGAYIAAMQAKEQALKDYQATLANSALTEDAKAFLNEQGAESAAVFLAGYKTATPAQQAELNRIWSEAGVANSATYTASVGAGFAGKSIQGPAVSLGDPNVPDFIERLQQNVNNRRIIVAADLLYRNGSVSG